MGQITEKVHKYFKAYISRRVFWSVWGRLKKIIGGGGELQNISSPKNIMIIMRFNYIIETGPPNVPHFDSRSI